MITFRLQPSTLRSTTSLVIGRRSRLRQPPHPLSLASFQNNNGSLCKNIVLRHHQRYTFTTTFTATTSATIAANTAITRGTVGPRNLREIFQELRKSPLQYATIPAIAACMAMYTNWIAVKMLFYPIEYMGTEWYREEFVPYGIFGWQGVVPCKTEKMASRLVDIVTKRLLSIEEAFGRLDASQLASLLLPIVEAEIKKDCGGGRCGDMMVKVMHPFLPMILTRVISNLQIEIGDILDLRSVVLEAFMRDKVVLVELFQKVGRVELDFLVESGLGFGFLLGLVQMVAWVMNPKPWTLPVAGAIVGYVTNWIAIKLLFDPVEPVQCGPIVIQGLFESRQVEVSDEFGTFMAKRVLNSGRLLEALAQDADDGKLYSFLRRQLPYPVPEFILSAAVTAIGNAAKNHNEYPDLHQYMTTTLDIESTLAHRLKLLSPSDFEDLLHPVFKEDETILIAAGGIFGALAGLGQTQLGWGGPGATMRALITLAAVSASSLGYFLFKEIIEEPAEVIVEEAEIVVRPVQIRRRNTLVKVTPEKLPDWLQIPEFR